MSGNGGQSRVDHSVRRIIKKLAGGDEVMLGALSELLCSLKNL
eukprot:COSAG01_NODE_73188_length_251_cov_0.486842_2_plen_42_part_01